MAVTAPLPDLETATGAAVAPVELDSHFDDPVASPDFAIFDTTLGTIPVLLTPQTTPITVANFRNYVNKGAYTNTVVHRSVPGFIWQAGGYQLNSTPSITPTPTDAPIRNEFGASNVRGTIAMAKLGNDPNSATSQFFFNESDTNAANLDNQNGGFTVFGRVVGASGLAVMDAIAGAPVPSPGPMASPLDAAPLQNYKAGASVQPSNLVLIKGVTAASEAFSTSSDAPGVATASVQGSQLIVTPLAAGTARITVEGYGPDGKAATDTFTVNVAQGSPSATTPPTTQPPGTATPPTAQPSDLGLATRGPLPASVVAGQKSRIQQTVSLTATTGNVNQAERITLSLSSTTTGSANDITVATVAKKLKLRAGNQARLSLSAKQVDPSVPAGTYHVLVSVTDPDGAKTTVDTGRTLIVRAPKAKPSTK